MKHTVKLIIKYILYGISWGCTFFVAMCLCLFAAGKEAALSPITEDFARQSLGAVLVGIACGTTPVVYQFNRLSWPVQILIHFSVGIGVFLPTAIRLGWIPFYPDKVIYTVMQFLFSCGIFAVIWFCFYLFNRNEAKEINNRLRELERKNGEE